MVSVLLTTLVLLPNWFSTMRVAGVASSGKSPYAVKEQALGARLHYELHHVEPIHQGGSVYDVSNLMITTPRFHLDVLGRNYHYVPES